MTMVLVSNKGQITLPAKARKRLGIGLRSRVEMEERDNEIVIRPARSIRDVAGIFKDAARGISDDMDEARRVAMEAVVQEYLSEEHD